MKKFFATIIITLASAIMMAAPVSQQTTERLANFFFHEHGGESQLVFLANDRYSHLHIYSASDGQGFVIMSSDDVVLPVLAYSTDRPFDINDIPASIDWWLHDYDNQISWNIEKGNEPSSIVTNEWNTLNAMVPSPQRIRNATAGTTANLLSTTWGQSPYYNSQCPYDYDKEKNTLTGCVATAMAQIMKYWEYPTRGMGSYSYNDPPYGTQSANFADTVFNYSLMPSSLSSSSSAAQVNAVALLMRRCGIAVEMEYGTNGSSASTIGNRSVGYKSAENAYRENFKYLHTLHSVSIADYTHAEWTALMKNEIDNRRPVQYSAGDSTDGGGHSFICCGYDNTDRLYFNWGWKGSYDGYYQIGYLNPGSSAYVLRNKAIIGIVPDTTNAATTTITLNSDIPGACTLSGAGTYPSYTSNVTIMAMANPGYLTDGWDDNISYNPYEFIANGGNVTHTARCSRMEGDTLGYCTNTYVTAHGSSSTNRKYIWGIRLDSFAISASRKLEKVSTYISETGRYIVRSYLVKHGEFPGTTANSSDTIHATEEDVWETVELNTPVAIDRTKDLWITLEWTGQGYPRSRSSFRGDINGIWVQLTDGTWSNYVTDNDVYGSWMIRGIFSYNPGPYAIVVKTNKPSYGTAYGSGTYPRDTTITIKAVAKNGYRFTGWSDGDTAAERNIVVKDVATYIAHFEAFTSLSETTDANSVAAFSNGKYIIVQNAEGMIVNIYDASGRLIRTKKVTRSMEFFEMPRGIYFIKTDNKTIKCII